MDTVHNINYLSDILCVVNKRHFRIRQDTSSIITFFAM